MKTIKPLKLGLLHKTYEHNEKCTFAVTCFVFFDLRNERALLSEAGMWQVVAGELRDGEPLDECMPKARSEVLVTGNAYPRGGPSTACQVRLRLGGIDKTLYAIGDRRWQRGGTASDPTPFESMPISWNRAFGGTGYHKNPLGRGVAPIEGEDGERFQPLPNIEYPKKLIRAQGDKPEPAGFGAIDLSWAPRQPKAGTYDQKWLETRFPGYADDIDWTFFNQAPEDQQQDGFFRGDETLVAEHMHPSIPVLEGRLPGVAVRCFVNRSKDGIALEEIATRIDTVRLLPHLERGIAVFRGVLDVAEDDAGDVLQLVAGIEQMGVQKPARHYHETLLERLDKEKGALLALRDSDLLPEGWAPSTIEEQSEEISAHAELTRSDNLMRDNMRRGAARQAEQMRAAMRAAGLEPDEAPAPPEDERPPTVDELADYVAAKLRAADEEKARAEAERAEMERKARAQCEQQGLDWDAVVEDARKKSAGPPKFSADDEIDRLRNVVTLHRNIGTPNAEAEALLADPQLEERLRAAETQLRATYRTMCHHFPAAARVEGDAGAALRRAALEAVSAGSPFAERDFTGVDLSAVDLTKARLARGWLEAADLSGADLRGVDLAGAVLTRATLRGAQLAGANLRGANLAEADLAGADLSDAQLGGAVLMRAKLTETVLTGADLSDANLLEVVFDRTMLDRAKLPKALLYKATMNGVSAVGADLTGSNIVETSLSDADFSEAVLERTNFVTVVAQRASFQQAKLANVRIVSDSDFDGASFFGADMRGSNLRGTRLVGADLRQAQIDGCDLSECELSGAQLDLATAVDTLFIRTNLAGASMTNVNAMNGILQKANLEGTDLRGSNFFRADFAKIKGNASTKLDGANMNLIRFVDRRGGARAGVVTADPQGDA
jgi:uncharacterized protein YjbI with pentapeptide repeats